MPLDGFWIRGLSNELQQQLVGGRIDKVNQPEKDEIDLVIRNRGTNMRLLISANASAPRVQVTGESKTNPLSAPMFCMLLRKRLIGGFIESVYQPGMERILKLSIRVRDELGVISTLTLHAEMMGRHSNIILTDEQGKILECIKHITEEKSRVREVLPGLSYEMPPPIDRADPLQMKAEDFAGLIKSGGIEKLSSYLASHIAGLSTATARRFASLTGDPDRTCGSLSEQESQTFTAVLAAAYDDLVNGRSRPYLIREEGNKTPVDFTPIPGSLSVGQTAEDAGSYSEAMEAYYRERDHETRLREHAKSLMQAAAVVLERDYRKLDKQLKTLEGSEHMDDYKLYGELLTTYRSMAKKGMTKVDIPNYYDPECKPVSIPLDPALGSMENANLYYKKYRKARTAMELVKKQIEENEQEIEYLETVRIQLTQCGDDSEIQEIHKEMADLGYVKTAHSKGEKKLPPSRPRHFVTRDGYDIYVGRNNRQNDQLTLKFAHGNDLWFHTLKIPGSHVILCVKGGEASREAVESAMMLAAWFSQGRESATVPVDYTMKKYVHKPSGARPGFVIYTDQRTGYVTPREEAILALREEKE